MITKTYERGANIRLSHPAIGDGYFAPLVRQALAEFAANHDESSPHVEFTASNGVFITADFFVGPEVDELSEKLNKQFSLE
jgi:hypothetical protein